MNNNLLYPHNLLAAAFGECITLDGTQFDCGMISNSSVTHNGLQYILQNMDDRERTIIRLRYEENYPYTKIAAYVDLSSARISQIDKEILKRLKQWENRKYLVYGYEGTINKFTEEMENIAHRYGSLFSAPISEYLQFCYEKSATKNETEREIQLKTITIDNLIRLERNRLFAEFQKDNDRFVFYHKFTASFLFLSSALRKTCGHFTFLIINVLKEYVKAIESNETLFFAEQNTFIPSSLAENDCNAKMQLPLKTLLSNKPFAMDWFTLDKFGKLGIETVGDLLCYKGTEYIDNRNDLETLLDSIGISSVDEIFVALHRYFNSEFILKLDVSEITAIKKAVQNYISEVDISINAETRALRKILLELNSMLS